MGEEIKFLWRDADAGEDSPAVGLVNSFLEGVKGSGLSEDFKLHVVQGDNKIDFNKPLGINIFRIEGSHNERVN